MKQQDASAPPPRTVPLPPLPQGWQIVRYALMADHRLAMIGTNVDLHHEWRRDGNGMPLGRPHDVAAQARARIWLFDGSALSDGPEFPLLTPIPIFDRFPDGRWLVASIRALDHDNARILTSEGSELGRIRLGDGIQRLKIDDCCRIWVGWFDEGVFGNEDWRVPGEEWPPSAFGLAAFDEAGALIAFADGAPRGAAIADCYALNTVGDTAWACTYTDFPILACSPSGGSRWWPTELKGPGAIAVHPPLVLAAGGYAQDGNRAVLLELNERLANPLSTWRLPFNLGYPGAVDLFDARGDALHVVQNGCWHRWSVADFVDGGSASS